MGESGSRRRRGVRPDLEVGEHADTDALAGEVA
jgi:hypothetical protein